MGKHKPVNKTLAQECAERYKKIYQHSSDPEVKKSFTDGVVFDKAELISWLNTIPTPSVKITFGIYTPAFVEKYPTAKVGRLSTFIFPSATIPHASSGPIIAFSLAADAGDPPPPPPPPSDEDPLNLGDMTP
jgi:hypothetical protein